MDDVAHTHWMLVASTIVCRDVPWRDHVRMDANCARRPTEFRGVSGQYRLERQRRTQNQPRYNSQPHSLSSTLTCSTFARDARV
jgi:hypothetical protein